MDPKFKVGDRVRIKKRVFDGAQYRYGFVDSMADLEGKSFTVQKVTHHPYGKPDDYAVHDDTYRYDLNNGYIWSSGMLESIFSISPKNKKHVKLNFNL